MLKREKNCFIKLCDKLEDDYFPYENEITYVRRYFLEELSISKDIDKLLKLKAEGEEMNYESNLSITLSMLALSFSVLSLFNSLNNDLSNIETIILSALTILICITITIRVLNDDLLKSKHFKKWKKYVLCVVNQLIEEHREEVKSKIKKGKKVKDKNNKP